MSTDTNQLSTHELAVIESLHTAEDAVSQREIARRTGLSVGLINAVMQKLVHTGYVKTSHLNRRSLDYLLTPQGFAQAAMKSYRYVLGTVRSYRDIQLRLEKLIDGLAAEGISEFYLNGECELAELVAMLFRDGGRGNLKRGIPEETSGKIAILNTTPSSIEPTGYRVVDLISELSNGRSKRKNGLGAELK